MKSRGDQLAVAKTRSPRGGGHRPSGSGIGGSASWRLCIINAPSAKSPESVHTCLVNEGIDRRRVNVREYEAS